jgi:hypothetical protein
LWRPMCCVVVVVAMWRLGLSYPYVLHTNFMLDSCQAFVRLIC